MKFVGLDFGTTNSILSYYDDKNDSVKSHRFGGVDGDNYIPSFLAISKDDNSDVSIGIQAKISDMEDYFVYSKFKMLLAEDDTNKLSEYHFNSQHPKDIASEYIKRLLEEYKEEQNIKYIEKIVITVPEIWLRYNLDSRKVLMEIIEEQKLPLKELISEPVAAGGYFIYRYQEEHYERYNGYLLIFDYGGGTLDISLLRLEDDNLEVLESTGNGHNINNIGNAGVAFDEIVVQTLYKNYYKDISTVT